MPSQTGKTKGKKSCQITKTKFKIVVTIKKQLKKHGSPEALPAPKLLHVKELLSRVDHYARNWRKGGLDGSLAELITSYSTVQEENLGHLLQDLAPLNVNRERVIRQVAVKVLFQILSNVTAEKVEPFFDIVCTYLRSAMTHIDARIQEDSLLFLDTLLRCTPERVAQDFHKILPNFLDMVSKLRVDSKPGRMDLDRQRTSVKWRVRVLDRLQDLLQTFVEQHNVSHTGEIKKDTDTAVCRLPKSTAHIDEVQKLEEYIETLVPLLFEIWVELCPNANTEKNIETVVGDEAAVLLKLILEVVVLLWELVQYYDRRTPGSMLQNTFWQNHHQPFNEHFVQAFPFVTHSELRQPETDPLVVENLEICHLFIMLNPDVNENQEQEMSAVLHYIEEVFNETTNDEVMCNHVFKILNTVFLNVVNNWNKNTLIMGPMFRKIMLTYFNIGISNAFRQKIFALLCNISLENQLSHFVNTEPYKMRFDIFSYFISDILLSSSITRETVDIFLKYAICNNSVFNENVRNQLNRIIDNLPHLVYITSREPVTCFRLLSIFYWIRNFDTTSLHLLENQLLNGEYDVKYQKFLMDLLKLRPLEN